MKSIGFKLWAVMMALVMVVLLLLWLFQIVFLENFYTRMRISAVKNEGTAIAGLLVDGNRAEFENRLDAFAYNNNLSAELLDGSGKNVYTTGPTGAGGHMPMQRNAARREAFQAVLAGKETMILLTHPRFGNEFMLIGLPVEQSGGMSGVLLLNMSMAPVEDTALILKRQLFYITLMLLAAALLLSLLLSRSLTKPILVIKKTAEEMASGNFNARVVLKQQDEIGQLAGTINHLGQQLAQIEQLRKDLIANVSHELRTPLSIIRGYAETIRDVTGDIPAKREKQLEIIILETERLNKIVDDILNLSQFQSGLIQLKLNCFDLQQALAAVVKRYAVLSEKTGVQIIRPEAIGASVEADRERIEQVLYNLINNGLSHTPPGGKVTIKAIDRAQTVRIEVADTGTGIPAEDLPHIWDRYYKADKTVARSSLGTGLGLAIVKSILEAHGTAYGVTSQDGAGTTFWFELRKVQAT
ncbi:Alkaline phosphatase synthesis sensor protein PhoR [Sporotomaculum syntrophicum]|uniref:histidine kinase n=1 Tax=Sporotomaculum syntrophicum TaxID=182264 RepID=A0A9D2WQY6_9FIRM|nr:HAMP domain-containing sensor histidine kinase [Sporotomaculum syntrophicum]KAF1085296.1 Alkaline phosphatase synthesis sensor protein PhoR [Sporotomaculum syntrophicum]